MCQVRSRLVFEFLRSLERVLRVYQVRRLQNSLLADLLIHPIELQLERSLPVAPASNNASACTNPSPLAAPETRTTLSTRLNSGSRLVVPRYVGVFPLFKATSSASGAGGGARVGEALHRVAVATKVRFGMETVLLVLKARRVVRRNVLFILMGILEETKEKKRGATEKESMRIYTSPSRHSDQTRNEGEGLSHNLNPCVMHQRGGKVKREENKSLTL